MMMYHMKVTSHVFTLRPENQRSLTMSMCSIWFSLCAPQVSGEEVSKLLVSGIEPIKEIDPCFAEFTYTPRSLSDDSTPMVKGHKIHAQLHLFKLHGSKLQSRGHVSSSCSVSSACLKIWASSTPTRLTCTLSPGLTMSIYKRTVKNCAHPSSAACPGLDESVLLHRCIVLFYVDV